MGFRNLWNKISTTASAAQSVLRKDVPYTMGEEYARCGMWTLHYGVRKTDKQQVTIFKCREHSDGHYSSSSGDGSNASEMAHVNARRLRAIRHPSIIAFIDAIEMGAGNQFCIVTEFVRPLRETIHTIRHDTASSGGETIPVGYHEAISWGLYSVIRAIEFLHSKNMYLGALPMHSIFVDEAGEWKIGDLSFLSEIHPPGGSSQQQQQSGNNAYGFPLKRFSNLLENRYKPPELMSQRWDIIEQFPDTLDSWGVACLIHEVFEGEITHADQIRARSNMSSIPRGLNSHYKQLIRDNPTVRQRIPQLLESPYFLNKMIQTQLFLENIAIKDPSEIGIFISELSESIDTLPRASAKYKILPHLFNAIKYGSGGSSQAIATIFKIGSMMDEDEYGKHFIPEALNLFDVNSRAVRIGLLKNLGQIVPHLDSKSVEKRVYPHIAKGFVDPDPMLRAESLKSMVVLVPKLREKIVAEEVVKYMWTLQTDREPGIRTNTIIAFGMLAPHFSEDVRKRVMLHAFARSMKDPNVHARVAALKALNATKEYYTVKEVATKIIPVVSPLMIDTEQIARETAAQVLQIFLQFTIEISKSVCVNVFVILYSIQTRATSSTYSQNPSIHQPNFHEFLSQTKTSAAGSNGASSSREANTTEVWNWAMNAVSSVKTRLLGDSLEMSGSPILLDSGNLGNSNRQVGDRATSGTSGDRATTTSGYGSASQNQPDIATNGDLFADMNVHPNQQQKQQQQKRIPLNNAPPKKPPITQHQKQPSIKSGWEDDDLFDMSMRTNDSAIDNFLDSVSNNTTTTTTPTSAVGSGHSNSAQDFDPFADLDPFSDISRPSSKSTNSFSRPNLSRESKSESYRQASDVFNLSSSRYEKPHTNSDDLMPDFALDNNNRNTLAGKKKQNEWEGWDDF